jgi:hypothetical protein
VVPITFGRNKRSASPGYLLPFIGTAAVLLLIIAGIYAIGRAPIGMTLPH